jgi:ferritin-like metal-binding protein YciE
MPAAPQQTENQEMAQVRSKDRSAREDEYELEKREYRDERGDVHHHTRSYMERHGEAPEAERRQDRRRSAAPSRQRRTEASDRGSSLGNIARSIANRPVFLLAAAAAAGTFFLSRRIADEDFSRRGSGRDRDNEGFIPGTSWLREEILPSPETPRDVFITGLRNAHSVEVKAVQLLERQMQALKDYPDIRARLDQHLGETRNQLNRLETMLGELDESPSTIKDTLLAAFGNAFVIPQGMAGDAILKGAFASFAFENYEIAAYRSLITMTEVVGMPQFRAPLEASLREETAMAQWLGDNIPAVTRRYLSEIKAEA